MSSTILADALRLRQQAGQTSNPGYDQYLTHQSQLAGNLSGSIEQHARDYLNSFEHDPSVAGRIDQLTHPGGTMPPGGVPMTVSTAGAESVDTGSSLAKTVGAAPSSFIAQADQSTHLNELIGQARALGIPAAESLTPEYLAQQVSAKQAAVPTQGTGTDNTDFGTKLNVATHGLLGGAIEGLSLGTAHLALSMISRIPGGEALASKLGRTLDLDQAQQQFSQIQTATQNVFPENRRGYVASMTGAGRFIGMIPVGYAISEVGAALLPVALAGGAIGGLIGRGAIAGYGFSLGSNMPILPDQGDMQVLMHDPVDGLKKLAFGNRLGQTIFGAATAGAIGLVAQKLAQSPATGMPSTEPPLVMNSSNAPVQGPGLGTGPRFSWNPAEAQSSFYGETTNTPMVSPVRGALGTGDSMPGLGPVAPSMPPVFSGAPDLPPTSLLNAEPVPSADPRANLTQTGQLVVDHPNGLRRADGAPVTLYHGTGAPLQGDVDPAFGNPNSLTGPGFYVADRAEPSAGYPDLEYDKGYAQRRAQSLGLDQSFLQGEQSNDQALAQRIVDAGNEGTEAHQAVLDRISERQQSLDQATPPAPTVYTFHAIPAKTLRWDDVIEERDVHDLAGIFSAHPQMEPFVRGIQEHANNFIGEQIDGATYINPTIGDYIRSMQQSSLEDHMAGDTQAPMDPRVVNDALRQGGYDAIHNEGGIRGPGAKYGVQYNAYNILNPKVLLPKYAGSEYFAEHGELLASQLNKQSQILNSPTVAETAAAPVVTDTDVLKAVTATDPNHISVLRNITDPGATIGNLLEDNMKSTGLLPNQWRLVQRGDRVDLLSSTLNPITDQMAADYTQHGVMEGMKVQTFSNGVARDRIVSGSVQANKTGGYKVPVQDWTARVVLGKTGNPVKEGAVKNIINPKTGATELIVHPTAQTMIDSPKMWDDFQGYTTDKLAEYTNQTGEPATMIDGTGRRELPRILSNYFVDNSITDPATKAGLRAYFDNRLLGMYKDLAPEENSMLDSMHAEQDARDSSPAVEASRTPLVLEDVAKAQDFHVLRSTGEARVTLSDNNSDGTFHFENDQAAQAFLTTYSRELPQTQLPHPLPQELLTDIPADRAIDTSPGYDEEIQAGLEQADNRAAAVADEFSDAVDLPPESQPSYVRDGTVTKDETGVVHVNGEPLIQQPYKANAGNGGAAGLLGSGLEEPPHFGDVNIRNMWFHELYLQPVTSMLAKFEEQFFQGGQTWLRPREAFSRIMNLQAQSHNEAYPWYAESANNARLVGRNELRTGQAWQVFAADPANRMALAQQLGLDQSVVGGVNAYENMLGRMTSPAHVDEFRAMIEDVRKTQAAGNMQVKIDGAAYPNTNWFGHSLEDGQPNLIQPNLAKMTDHFIASYHFNKNVVGDWEHEMNVWKNFTSQFHSDSNEAKFGSYMLDVLGTLRRGNPVGEDAVVSGINAAQNYFQTTSMAQTREFINGGMGAYHSAVVGFRPWTALRNFTQVYMGAHRVGIGNINSVLADFATNKAAFNTAEQDMVSRGVAELDRVPNQDYTQDHPIVGQTAAQPRTFYSAAVRQGTTALGEGVDAAKDWMADMVPARVKAVLGPLADPMHMYGKADYLSRVVLGEAAKRQVMDFTLQVQTNITQAVQATGGFPDVRSAVGNLAAGMDHPLVRQLQDLAQAGDWKGFQDLYIREATSENLFNWSPADTAPGIQGTAARMALQFTGWTNKSVNWFTRITANAAQQGQLGKATKFVAGVAAFQTAAQLAEDKTGFKFRGWMFVDPGVPSAPVGKLVKGAFAVAKPMESLEDVSAMPSGGSAEAAGSTLRGAITGVPLAFNPAKGLFADANIVNNALMSPNPITNLARGLLSGDTEGAGTTNRLESENYYDKALQQIRANQATGAPQGMSVAPNHPAWNGPRQNPMAALTQRLPSGLGSGGGSQ